MEKNLPGLSREAFPDEGENAASRSASGAAIEDASDPGLRGAPDCPEGARLIPLTRGLFAIVDEGDYERVSAFKWHARLVGKGGKSRPYAAMCVGRRAVYLHNFIFPPPPGLFVDHRGNDGLDCRRGNLRHATRAQNNRNRRGAGVLPKGVRRQRSRFAAQITVDRRYIYLGTFESIEAAALAYNRAATRYFGEFAKLNVIEGASVASHASNLGGESPCTTAPEIGT